MNFLLEDRSSTWTVNHSMRDVGMLILLPRAIDTFVPTDFRKVRQMWQQLFQGLLRIRTVILFVS